MSETADLIDSAADRLAVCLHLYRPFIGNAIEAPSLIKVQIGPTLTLSKPSYRLGDPRFRGGDEKVTAYFTVSLPDGRSLHSVKFEASFHSEDEDNMAVVGGNFTIFARVKSVDISRLNCCIQGCASRGSFHRATCGDSRMTEACWFAGLGQHEHVSQSSGFRCKISTLSGSDTGAVLACVGEFVSHPGVLPRLADAGDAVQAQLHGSLRALRRQPPVETIQ